MAAAAIMMDVDALNAFLGQAFPESSRDSRGLVIDVAPGRVRTALTPGPANLRPGGIVSGPTQMALADTAAYALVLAHIGPVAMAVTSSLSYQFLRACPVGTLYADASLLKLGRRLVVSDVRLWVDDETRPVGQASVTYALP
jgi:uncharacterized protein (TIGR00369 family)